MPTSLPTDITRDDLLHAIHDFDAGAPHAFADSTGYDVLHEGRRYPPKAIVGLAAERRAGHRFHSQDFRGGLGTQCFQVLERCGFTIVRKQAEITYPDELESRQYTEGVGKTVVVNRYERDAAARAACISHYGAICQVCCMSFEKVYGQIGEGFIHVHHLVRLSDIRTEYTVDPIRDLRPVCPNCHAMLHTRAPPILVETLREWVQKHGWKLRRNPG